MSAKPLNAFTDDHPDLHRQMGCMRGLFQMLDRRRLLLAGRHLRRNKRTHSGNLGAESHEQENNLNRNMNENQRTSVESSRPSFSSSSGCSSFSSFKCNTSTQHEGITFQETDFHETSSRKFQQNINSRPDHCFKVPGYASLQVSHQSPNFKGIVKELIYRDGCTVLNKSTEEVKKNVISHGDSQGLVPMSKLKDRTSLVERNRKSRTSLNVDESLGLVAASKEPCWLFSELKEPRRSSCEAKEDSFFTVPKEFPHLSCDSYVKSATKPKDFPCLSLDGRESNMRSSNLNCLDTSCSDQLFSRDMASNQAFAVDKNPSNIVAKLMGLEAMPRLSCGSLDSQLTRTTSCKDVIEDERKDKCLCNSPKLVQEGKQDKPSLSKRSNKNKLTMQRQNANSRISTEPSTWTQKEKICFSQVSKYGCREAPMRQQQESVYCEIDKKLEELELLQSNKDFRALKLILHDIQAKHMSQTKQKQEFGRNETFDHQSTIRCEKSKSADCHHLSSIESPIVIMKPTKPMKKCSSPTAIVPLEGLAGLRKVQITKTIDTQKTSTNNEIAKDRTPRSSPKGAFDHLHASRNKKSGSCVVECNLQGQCTQRLHGSSSPRTPSKENNGSYLKTSCSSSPRKQQRKVELPKRSQSSASFPPTAESHKQRKQSKQPSESVPPRAKLKLKKKHIQKPVISCESRYHSYQNDEISISSDVSLASQVDSDVNCADQSNKLSISPARVDGDKENIDSLASVMETKKSLVELGGKNSSSKLEVNNSEQPSPISILDASFYKDDSPSSPTDETLYSIKDIAGIDGPPFGVLEIDPSTKVKHNKLRNIDILIQKLGQLTLSEEELAAFSHIAKLWCDSQDTIQRYISEVLLASGLLFQDFRLQQSGHAINPDLFLMLEQRRSNFTKPECASDIVTRPMLEREKLHRKLVFDIVDEILVQKLELGGLGAHPGTRIPSGQSMLQDLCSEINHLQAGKLQISSSSNEENDSLEMILSQDVMCRSRQWNSSEIEVSEIMLDIERSIFKDLVNELITLIPR